MDSSFDLIVTKASVAYASDGVGTIADQHDIATLVEGAIAIFVDDGALVAAAVAATDIDDNAGFYIGQQYLDGNGNTYVKFTNMFRRDAAWVKKVAYVAPVKKVIAVGNDQSTPGASINFPSTLVTGTVASLMIWREEIPGDGMDKFNSFYPSKDSINIQEVVKTSDTDATVLDRMITQINNHESNTGQNQWVVAAALGTPTDGIQLTASDFKQDFGVAVDDIAQDADVIVTTEIVYGTGSSADVAELEGQANIYRGDTNQVWLTRKFYNTASSVVDGETYILYSITDKKPGKGVSLAANDGGAEYVAVIAVPDGDGLVSTLDTIFAVLFLTPGSDQGGLLGSLL